MALFVAALAVGATGETTLNTRVPAVAPGVVALPELAAAPAIHNGGRKLRMNGMSSAAGLSSMSSVAPGPRAGKPTQT